MGENFRTCKLLQVLISTCYNIIGLLACGSTGINENGAIELMLTYLILPPELLDHTLVHNMSILGCLRHFDRFSNIITKMILDQQNFLHCNVLAANETSFVNRRDHPDFQPRHFLQLKQESW